MRRSIKITLKSKPTVEGAGVHLKRAFGYREVPLLDPFLLLDDFHSDDPEYYLNGFPWHPHRGIETITYVLHGEVEHGDSMGNKGTISPGDVQWMTAGSGIIHQEMPRGEDDGLLWGFQLWANLPSSGKMMDPRYRGIGEIDIPEIIMPDGTKVKIICGNLDGTEGPVKDIVIDPEYLDVTVPPETVFNHRVKKGHTVFAYIIEGAGHFDENRKPYGEENLVIFDDGDELSISASGKELRFLLISGRPIGEPVAWYGPIVMNTEEELKLAFEEYQDGTFIKKGTEIDD
jgi:hypothetical protein